MKKLALLASLVASLSATLASAALEPVAFDGEWRHHSEFKCFARAPRGELFEALAEHEPVAREEALQRCFRHSRHCSPAGCKKLR
jgi:hypothetical protein